MKAQVWKYGPRPGSKAWRVRTVVRVLLDKGYRLDGHTHGRQREIADAFGVSQSLVSMIVSKELNTRGGW